MPVPDRAQTSDVTVVVVNWRQAELTARALTSLRSQTISHRVLLVDNASGDGSVDSLAAGFPEVEVLELPENVGFAGGMAAALARVDTRFVALLNNDAVAEPGWLEHSLAALEDPTVAAASAKLLLDDGAPERRINNAGVVLLETGYGADRGLGEPDDERFAAPVEVFGFSGGAAVLRTLAVKAVGGFDPSLFMYYEDTDLSWRLRLAGWRIVYVPQAVVHHRHAASSDQRSRMFAFHTERNRLLLLARHAPLPYAVGAGARFLLTTASLAAKRVAGVDVPDEQVFDPRLRLQVTAAVARRLPGTLAARRRAADRAERGGVHRRWRGRDHEPALGA
jgi:GT2 family glycosyltransferase